MNNSEKIEELIKFGEGQNLTGIQRIMKYFSESNLPLPEFRNISEGFLVTVFITEKSKVTDNQMEKSDVPKDDPKEIRLKNLLRLINENTSITLTDLALECKVSLKTVKRDLEILKMNNQLKRIGGKKFGHWEIL